MTVHSRILYCENKLIEAWNAIDALQPTYAAAQNPAWESLAKNAVRLSEKLNLIKDHHEQP